MVEVSFDSERASFCKQNQDHTVEHPHLMLWRLTPNSVFQVSAIIEDDGLLDMSRIDPIRDESVGKDFRFTILCNGSRCLF